jgi:hypothetical protein
MSGTSQTFHASPSSAPTGRGKIKPVMGVRGLVPQDGRRDVVQGPRPGRLSQSDRRVIVDFLGPTAGKNPTVAILEDFRLHRGRHTRPRPSSQTDLSH